MNAKETAVIFIEFQNDFCTEGGKLYSLVEGELKRNATLSRARRLLDETREKGCLVIHCPFILDAEWVQTHGCTGLLDGIRENEIFAPDTWGQEIIPAMRPGESEIVLEKKHALSAFSHTALSDILAANGIKNLIVCGLLTNVCVLATALSAYDRGLAVRIALDACCAATEPLQRYVEENLPGLLGGESRTESLLKEIG